jgi:UDP-glucose 4-epimerase
MDLSDSHILITGGAGFIGSHCVDALLACGARVTVVDDLSSGRAERVPAGVELIELDIRDDAAVLAALTRVRPDGVLHLAAQVSVPRSLAEPAADAAINVLGTANVLTAAIATGVRAFVNTSSGGAVYGDGPVPADESAPIAPLSPYGASKAAAERYVDWAADTQGIAASSLRLANVYGPRQDDQGEAGVVAIFVTRALAGHTLELHGDGEQTRDFVHVSDVVRAQLAALQSEARGAFNVGTGAATSIRALAEAVRAAAGADADAEALRFGPARDGDVRHSRLVCDQLSERLGLVAEVSLVDGVRDTVDYWRALTRTSA